MDDDSGPGVPEWVVTYGDMMSLLLTFFIMLVSLSEVAATEKYRAILDSLQRYVGYRSGPLAPPGRNFPLNSLIESIDMLKLGSFVNEDEGTGGVRTKAVVGPDYRVFRTREGTALRVGSPILFRAGEAELAGEARQQLRAIAAQLGGKPNKIEVRGFASDFRLPPNAPYADRLVLSYVRAYNAREFLAEQGIAVERMRISMAAVPEGSVHDLDQRMLDSDRVEVIILDAFAEEFVGPREALH